MSERGYIGWDISKFNLDVDNIDYGGMVKSFTPPKIEYITEDIKPGGGNGTFVVQVGGLEKLEIKAVLVDANPNLASLVTSGKIDGQQITFSAIARNQKTGERVSLQYIMAGRWNSYDLGDVENGETNEVELNGAVTVMTIQFAGTNIREIDINNLIDAINNSNQLDGEYEMLYG